MNGIVVCELRRENKRKDHVIFKSILKYHSEELVEIILY